MQRVLQSYGGIALIMLHKLLNPFLINFFSNFDGCTAIVKIRLCPFPLPCILLVLVNDLYGIVSSLMMFCVRTCFPAHGAFPCHHSCIKRCPAFVNTFNHSHEFSLFRLELNPATFTNNWWHRRDLYTSCKEAK
jgi:hypothetical protein